MTRPFTIEKMQAVAAERGGRCLSVQYVNSITALEWECAHGHRWSAIPGSVVRGSWCGTCARKKPRRLRITLDDMQVRAEAHGGRCLSEAYQGARTPLEWACAEGHRWFAMPSRIKEGQWCPACTVRGRPRLLLADIQRMAEARGGRCLSGEYTGNHAPLQFECATGHRWLASASSLHRGSWCPWCYQGLWYDTIDEMHALAASHGGECLSGKYENTYQPLRWRCANGHEWDAPAHTVKRHWCKRCFHERRRLGIDRMREIAASHGGRCLSEVYLSIRHSLQWECRWGHVWSTKPAIVLGGHWCPLCANLAQSKKRSKRLKYDFEG
ncbi:hypothetical protein [Paraburkholderia caballeronis]|uniref:hypothetical protein n=1 Tax=Paraburkholderia caballeronis TaxID=416943 RepID=UPI0010654797|nr:hypothetical protein [Paraburkholderia caballeronis]